MLLMRNISFTTHIVFQSSSGCEAGCYGETTEFPDISFSFNPHPAVRPDATILENLVASLVLKFQSSSGCEAGCYAPALDRWTCTS